MLSVLLFIAGVTGCDQRDVPSFMAFFIINNACSLLLSSSSPIGAMALSEVMACSGAFSQMSSSANHFPSCSRVNVTHKNRGRFDGEIKKKERTVRRAVRSGGEVEVLGSRMIPSSPI